MHTIAPLDRAGPPLYQSRRLIFRKQTALAVQNNDANWLAERLKTETDAEHRSLEARLGFDLHNPDQAIAMAMLRGFYGVLVPLEPAMLAHLPVRLADRGKLTLLRHDLSALGLSEAAIQAIPSPPAPWLPTTQAQALGAMYVTEGSTLGGKLIVKALRRLPEWPLSNQSYFDPYDAETGARWQAFKLHLNGTAPQDGDAVVDAAKRTFALLEHWMVETKA